MNHKPKSGAALADTHSATTLPAGVANSASIQAAPSYITTNAYQKEYTKKKSAPSSSKNAKKVEEHVSHVDFSTFDDKILKRYKRTFKLRTKSSRDRDRETHEELVKTVSKHFHTQEVNENESIAFFIYSLRNQGNVFKLPAKTTL
ncbi:uncharacterized protein EV422DRAFT_571347 [Fimicolochytrium jonesii]|uniref:uncharacterized protein n=1 Tax=Fimicolochytrium jonesii TaxID=1396493 RepID=UPI0022FEE1A0|nr:uncharacterized protein EV422DRAFT_571347 [Fimicolochytrium jonesii]KAI8816822.1 hypothetical protein EV422DRAFT_571347 [Fimicolochytrium jonesii]